MDGVLAALAASALWSLNPAIISRSGKRVKPFTFTAIRAASALMALAPAAILAGGRLEWDPALAALALASAALGPGLGDSMYALAIKEAGGSVAVTMSYTYILVAAAVSHILLGEPVGACAWAGAAVALAGIYVALCGQGRTATPRGLAAALSASLFWGLATALIKPALALADPLTLAALRLAFAAALAGTLGLVAEGAPSAPELSAMLLPAALTGILGWSAGMVLFIYAIGRVGAAVASVATALTPVLSQLTLRALSGERPSRANAAGAALVAAGVFMASRA